MAILDHDDTDDGIKNEDNLGVTDMMKAMQELPCERLFSNWSGTDSQSGPGPDL